MIYYFFLVSFFLSDTVSRVMDRALFPICPTAMFVRACTVCSCLQLFDQGKQGRRQSLVVHTLYSRRIDHTGIAQVFCTSLLFFAYLCIALSRFIIIKRVRPIMATLKCGVVSNRTTSIYIISIVQDEYFI